MSPSFPPLSTPALGGRVLALVKSSLLAGGALPAEAALFDYSFSGYYGNSQGPVKAGKFVGTMTWDSSAGNGTGGWSCWDISSYEKVGNGYAYAPGNRSSSNSLCAEELANPVSGSNLGAGYHPTAFCLLLPSQKACKPKMAMPRAHLVAAVAMALTSRRLALATTQ